MTRKEFENSEFFYGIKGKVDGIWYPLIGCDFYDRSITITDGSDEMIIQCENIEELNKHIIN